MTRTKKTTDLTAKQPGETKFHTAFYTKHSVEKLMTLEPSEIDILIDEYFTIYEERCRKAFGLGWKYPDIKIKK